MKLKVLMIITFILIYSISLYTTTQTKNEQIQIALNTQIQDLQTHYDLTMDYFINDATSIKANLSNNKKAIQLFSKAQNGSKEDQDILRDQLYNLIQPLYQRIRLRGILQWQFVFPDNTSFLRMHKPSKYGDDLTPIRYSFKQVNEKKKTIIGFEQGKTTHAFRYVFPYYDKKGNHIGAIEISLDSHAIQKKLLNVNKIHSHFLVKKNIFHVNAWEAKGLVQKYVQSIEHEDFMFTFTKDSHAAVLRESKKNMIVPLQNKINKGVLAQKAFSVYRLIDGDAKVITFLPIENAKQKDIVAYIVSYTDNNNITNISEEYTKSNVIRFFGLLVLLYFIYKNLNHKNELENEVKEKTKKLQDLNENLEQKILIEVEKNKLIQKKLFKSEKLASMGDMIGNIAHQWRQPLSVISTAATGMIVQKEFCQLSDKQLIETCHAINRNAQYLSNTIDDFSKFIQGKRNKKVFNISTNINSFLQLVEGTIKSHNIKVVLDLDDKIKINGYDNELTQCFLNIFNNAKDILIENNIDNKFLFISSSSQDNHLIIKIRDNANGIPEEIINNIFEPYFTTKHKSQGTGLGLHMTYNLIVQGMKGSIDAKNVKFTYNEQVFEGAEFVITLPLDI